MSALAVSEGIFYQSIGEGENQNKKYSVITPLTPEFLREVEDCNQEKPNAPLALVLRAGSDNNQILSSPASRQIILQIAKTYRVAIREVQIVSHFGRAIRDASEGEPIRLLYIFAHGNTDFMEFGEKETEHYTIDKLHPSDFEPLAEDAPIMLYSCLTGIKLAPRMAEVSRRIVQAPIDTISDVATIFCSSNPPKFLSYDENGVSLVRQFHPSGAFEKMKIDKPMKEELFSEKSEYIFKLASKGDRDAQYALGRMFQKGIGVSLCLESAENWIRKAAEQGLPKAQNLMGDFYCNGWGGLERSSKNALEWYRLAAEQGDRYGQIRCQQIQFVEKPKPVRDILFNMFELAN